MTSKVIVADDNEDIRGPRARHIGRQYDAEVDEVSDGSSLVDKVRSNVYSLVLTDNQMPGMGGLEAVRRIREFNQEVPIYMISASDAGKHALEFGATGYIDKGDIARYGSEETLDPILDRHLVRRQATV